MRSRVYYLLGLLLAVTLTILLTATATAQNKAAKVSNVQGRVQMINKDTSTITITTSGTVKRDVIYSSDTKFLFGHSKKNTPGAVDQVKNDYFISCAGTYASGKAQMTAKECIYRETK